MALGIGQLARTGRTLRRLAPLIRVLGRHGFGHYVHRFTPQHLMRHRHGEDEHIHELPPPVRVRMIFEELGEKQGPTYIKLGQMLATRNDLLPEAYLEELRSLTEHVPPFDTLSARRTIEQELKHPITELFAEFSELPVASGSIGQVYHARLKTGAPVVVKVRRPGIERQVLADLDVLELLASVLERLDEFKPLRPMVVVDEFRRSLLREVDFITEASFTSKVRADLADNPRVAVPAVYWDLCTSSVLVLERLDGVSLNRKAELAAYAVDRRQLARDLAEVFLHQFFRTGLFHADPHPGNILVMADGRIGLVDFGMAGRLSGDLRDYLATSFIALARHDIGVITDVYMEIGAIAADTDVERLKAELQETLDKYYGIPMRCLDLRRCFSDALRIARVHHVLLPRDFVLLGKSFVTMAMMARELDPEFNLAAVAQPYALRLVADKFSPKQIGQNLLHEGWYLGQALRRLPRELRALMRKLLGGTLRFTLHLEQFDTFVKELDRATNRLAFSVLIGAIIIGSSVLLHAHVPPTMRVLPWIGAFFEAHMPQTSLLGMSGFLVAGVLGLLLSVAIWRSGKL